MGWRWSTFLSPQPHTSQSRKTTDMGLVHRVVCLFTPQLLLVLINRPRRDGTLRWHWYTAAAGRIWMVGLKIEIHKNLWNSMCIINKNPASATKFTSMKQNIWIQRKQPLNERLPRNPVLLTKYTHSHAFNREHSTRCYNLNLRGL